MTTKTSEEGVRLTKIISPSFYEVYNKIYTWKYKQVWLKGGRGSTKSSFIAIMIVLGIVEDSKANAILFRKFSNTIRESVHTKILWAIDVLGLNDYFESKVSPPEIIYTPTGQKIVMRGLDKPTKIKSIALRKGYFKFLWFEEFEEFLNMQEIRSVQQSILRGGMRFLQFFSFNPPRNPVHWINVEIARREKLFKCLVHHSTYLDTPKAWLGSQFFEDAEELKENNMQAYRHEYLGESVGNVDDLVLYDRCEIKEFDEPNLLEVEGQKYYQGCDFGFSQDPTVLIQMFVKDNILFIFREVSGLKLTPDELPDLFENIKDYRKWMIRADSSRPETIAYLAKNHKINIISCTKSGTASKGFVEDGIERLRAFKKIVIHPNCIKTIEESEKYAYKIDKDTNKPTDLIIDAWNHCWDAIRYGLEDYWKMGRENYIEYDEKENENLMQELSW